MPDMFDRIELAIEMRGMTKNSISVAAGLAQGHLVNVLKRRKSMSALTLLDIARALDVTTDWLLTGEGPIERWKPETRAVASLAKPRTSSPPGDALAAAALAPFEAPAKKRAVRKR